MSFTGVSMGFVPCYHCYLFLLRWNELRCSFVDLRFYWKANGSRRLLLSFTELYRVFSNSVVAHWVDLSVFASLLVVCLVCGCVKMNCDAVSSCYWKANECRWPLLSFHWVLSSYSKFSRISWLSVGFLNRHLVATAVPGFGCQWIKMDGWAVSSIYYIFFGGRADVVGWVARPPETGRTSRPVADNERREHSPINGAVIVARNWRIIANESVIGAFTDALPRRLALPLPPPRPA